MSIIYAYAEGVWEYHQSEEGGVLSGSSILKSMCPLEIALASTMAEAALSHNTAVTAKKAETALLKQTSETQN